MESIIFGPMYSRRIGYSLGILNVPRKTCSFNCIYCQAGKTTRLLASREMFYDPRRVLAEVLRRLEEARVKPEYVTFIPDGEPTLDAMLGEEARLIKRRTGLPVAVFTNSSLLFREDVRRDLLEADLVSVKLDTASREKFVQINRPHPSIVLERVIKGLKLFAREHSGKVISETMIVEGVNDSVEDARRVAEVLAEIDPSQAYILVPVRPPCEPWVKPPTPAKLNTIYEVFKEILGSRVKVLAEREELRHELRSLEDVVAASRVHPIPLELVEELAKRERRSVDDVLEELGRHGVEIVEWGGDRYLVHVG